MYNNNNIQPDIIFGVKCRVAIHNVYYIMAAYKKIYLIISIIFMLALFLPLLPSYSYWSVYDVVYREPDVNVYLCL